MKKKIVSLCLVVALLAVAVVGGTLAYFTDTDDAVNVMTSGKADIIQNEQQRVATLTPKYAEYDAAGDPVGDPYGYDVSYAEAEDGKVSLEAFKDYKVLVPAVYYNADGTVNTTADNSQTLPDQVNGLAAYDGLDGAEHKLLDKSVQNEIDKIITVTNEGTVPVYVRTIILFEANGGWENFDEYMFTGWDGSANGEEQNSGAYNWVKDPTTGEVAVIEINGVKYVATVHWYEEELLPKQTTAPSLKQFFLLPTATNETATLMMGTDYEYTILALSQAVQADGFEDDRDALNAAFDEVTPDNVKEWFQKVADDNDAIGENHETMPGHNALDGHVDGEHDTSTPNASSAEDGNEPDPEQGGEG